MSSENSLKVVIDGAGGANAFDYRAGKIIYIQNIMGTDVELSYQAVRELVPYIYKKKESMNSTHWRALKALEFSKEQIYIIVPKSLIDEPQWILELARYENFVKTTLNWSVFPVTIPDEFNIKFDTLASVVVIALQRDWQMKNEFIVDEKTDPIKSALDVIAPSPMKILEIQSHTSKVYAGKDYVQKRFSSFVEYAVNQPVSLVLEKAKNFHRESLDGNHLAMLIDDSLINYRPFSFVRVGEGEGCFLSYEKYLAHRDGPHEVFGICAKDIYRIWFDRNIHEDEPSKIHEIKYNFMNALDKADVIGVPTPERVVFEFAHFLNDMKKTGYSRGYVGIAEILENIICEINKGGLKKSLFTDCDIARPLYEWQDWKNSLAATLPRLLYRRSNVTLVTCHAQLASALENFLELKNVRTLLIPPERGRINGAGLMIGDHYMDHFERINKLLKQDPGSIVLVAAGFFGKIYCATAKSASSVALDIGSLADYWVGMNTRSKASYYMPSPFSI
jgi:hypothetical protein